MFKIKHLNIFTLRKPTPYPVATGLVTAVLGILAVILGRGEKNIVNRIQIKLHNRKLEKVGNIDLSIEKCLYNI